MIINFKDFSSSRRFGIEIELSNNLSKKKIKEIINVNSNRGVKVSRYAVSYDNKNWHVKTDGSCGPRGSDGPNGVEIATFVCSSLKDLHHILKIVKKIKDHGGIVNDNCGLHIHADAIDLDEESVGRILMYWLTIEPILMFALPIRRWNNKYCQNLKPKFDSKLIPYQYNNHGYRGVFNIYRPQTDDYMARRKNLNLVNFYNALRLKTNLRKTLELRWPEGSVDCEDIKNWVLMFVSFIDNVKKKDFSYIENLDKNKIISLSDFFDIIGFGHDNNFSIFDSNIYKTKIWLLNRFANSESIYGCPRVLEFFHLSALQKSIKNQAQTILDKISINQRCNNV